MRIGLAVNRVRTSNPGGSLGPSGPFVQASPLVLPICLLSLKGTITCSRHRESGRGGDSRSASLGPES